MPTTSDYRPTSQPGLTSDSSDDPTMISLPLALTRNLESLAEEALQAMETANTASDEPIYTASSLSAALATLETLRAAVRDQDTQKHQGHDKYETRA